MTRNANIRREMGMDMPVPARDMAAERFTVTTKSHVPEPQKSPMYMIVGGVVMVQEDGGWRYATAEEIEQITGGVLCWPDNEEGEL